MTLRPVLILGGELRPEPIDPSPVTDYPVILTARGRIILGSTPTPRDRGASTAIQDTGPRPADLVPPRGLSGAVPGEQWTFEIPGSPVGKGRPRFGRRGKGAKQKVVTFTPEKTERYENLVAMAARPWLPREPIEGPLAVEIVAVLQRPKSKKKGERLYAPVKPDSDNLAKSILDGCSAYFADQHVVDLRVVKYYAAQNELPHARVTIRKLEAA